MARRNTTHEADIDDMLAECYADPLRYVMLFFPWDFDTSIQVVKLAPEYRSRFNSVYGPDVWACQFLDDWGAEIRNRGFDGRTAVDPIRFATASGHGIGKSVLAAWIVKFIMDTRPFSKGTVTATTAPQLRTRTWAEVGKWHKMSLTAHRFEYRNGQTMSLAHREVPEQWYCQAVTCKEENSEAFAGQHAANATSFYLFDEASGVPDKIYEVRNGGLTDGEPMVFDFGNPTRNTGMFYENCIGKFAHRYRVRSIDSRTVAITNKGYNDQLIADWGLDSDYVKVRVKGEFPSAGSTQFIPTSDVKAAMERELTMNRSMPLVLGVDVGGRGGDETVIKARIGDDARSWPAVRMRGLDTVQVVGRIIGVVNEFRAIGLKVHAIFVDAGGIGAGVADQLLHLGYPVVHVQFGGGASDPRMYRRLGDEIWGKMREAIHTRLCLPEMPQSAKKSTLIGHNGGPVMETNEGSEWSDLQTQLTSREYGLIEGTGQIHLEGKKDMKKRGVPSPDLGDALALTYAQDLAPLDLVGPGGRAAPAFCIHEYDPLGASH